MNYLENHELSSNYQLGFRSSRSTETVFLQFIYMSISFLMEISVNGLFLDYSKAIDSLNHQILFRTLQNFGIIGQPLQLFRSYLSDKKPTV